MVQGCLVSTALIFNLKITSVTQHGKILMVNLTHGFFLYRFLVILVWFAFYSPLSGNHSF